MRIKPFKIFVKFYSLTSIPILINWRIRIMVGGDEWTFILSFKFSCPKIENVNREAWKRVN